MVLRRLKRWLLGAPAQEKDIGADSNPDMRRPEVPDKPPQPEPTWKKYGTPSKPLKTRDDLIAEQAHRLVDLINESMDIAKHSSDPETRVSRVDFAEQKLQELTELSVLYPRIKMLHVAGAKAEIDRLRSSFTATVSFSADALLRSHGTLADLDGKPTYAFAHMKQDLDVMQACMRAETENYWRQPEGHRLIAAPSFFERVAILQRKDKNYEAEIAACEEWLKIVDDYKNQDAVKNGTGAMVWLGARSRKIMDRLPRARELLEKQRATV